MQLRHVAPIVAARAGRLRPAAGAANGAARSAERPRRPPHKVRCKDLHVVLDPGILHAFPESVAKGVLPLARYCCMDGNLSWVRPKVQPMGKMREDVVCDSLVGSTILVVC